MSARARELLERYEERVWRQTDRLFAYLMVLQWIGGIAIALTLSPRAWEGTAWSVHLNVWVAIFLVAAITALPVCFALIRPGWIVTRHVVAVGQMLFSAVLIHLTGGRIETHFHVFGSLAFLAFYRDWKVLISASAVVALDHFLRGVFWPQSVFGTLAASPWRWVEHAGWVIFTDIFLILSISRSRRETLAIVQTQAQLESTKDAIEREVRTRTADLQASEERFRLATAAVNSVIYEWDLETDVVVHTSGSATVFGFAPEEMVAARSWWWDRIHPKDRAEVESRLHGCTQRGEEFDVHYRFRDVADAYREVCDRGKLVRDEQGRPRRLVGTMEDVSERRRMEMELQQSQKLEAVGRLGAGIAHEINTPIQFLGDSIHFLRDAFSDIHGLLEEYRTLCKTAESGPLPPSAVQHVLEAERALELDQLVEEIPKALERSLEGTRRVSHIVRAMKEFSHPDRKEKIAVDLNHALSTTLTVANNELKYVADVETDFGDLPPVTCLPGELNQVFLNLLVNAAHAIAEVVGTSGEKGSIRVRTRLEDDQAVIELADTGAGISEEVQARVFDPFFTTKEVGRGTGQGLAIARSIVVEKHGGSIAFKSEPGKGTTFVVRLPVGSPTESPVLA